MAENPLYRIRQHTFIAGIGSVAREGEVDLSIHPSIDPRNSWEPLNDAAWDAFARRDKRMLAEVDRTIKDCETQIAEMRAAGGTDADVEAQSAELARLRLERARLPRELKKVPNFGGRNDKPTHSLVRGAALPEAEPEHVDHEIESARVGGATAEQLRRLKQERIERTINSMRSGGAREADIETVRHTLEAQIDDAPLVAPPAAPPAAPAPAIGAGPSVKAPKASKRASDSE